MKIGFFEIEEWEEKILKENLAEHELFFSSGALNEINPPQQTDFDVVSVFIDSRLTGTVIRQFPNLKLITTRSTGYDHIDLKTCARQKIPVAYVPGYGDNTVAEFAFSLLLNLTRKMYLSIDRVKESGSFSLEGLRGTDIKGKTIGIIGTGRIGKEAVKIAKGFGMDVLAYDPFPDAKFAEQMQFKYVNLETLLKTSDVITLHCPCNKNTEHLINRENVKVIKKGAYLINTARGSIVETQALVDGLEAGILAGVGTDVLEEEGETKEEAHLLRVGHPKERELRVILENHILMKMPNVLITPHNAFNSQEALERILGITIQTIKSFVQGELTNLVP